MKRSVCSLVVTWLVLLGNLATSFAAEDASDQVVDEEDIVASSFSRGYGIPGGSYGSSRRARYLASSDGFVVCPGQNVSGDGGGSGGSDGGCTPSRCKPWMCGPWEKTCTCKSCQNGVNTTGVYSRKIRCIDEKAPRNCGIGLPADESSGLTDAEAASYNITRECQCGGCTMISGTMRAGLVTLVAMLLVVVAARPLLH
eukprot:TRINITY_DN28845_c0_g1_i1.p1 TRINITY_DN28845_c0_g1~~TRINITY_DN28845_c0_g1_i1.p1  ORF type:complete len:220 (+),score=21.94 TRINITY_DN28845_c0_g1_i1:66-662(+)